MFLLSCHAKPHCQVLVHWIFQPFIKVNNVGGNASRLYRHYTNNQNMFKARLTTFWTTLRLDQVISCPWHTDKIYHPKPARQNHSFLSVNFLNKSHASFRPTKLNLDARNLDGSKTSWKKWLLLSNLSDLYCEWNQIITRLHHRVNLSLVRTTGTNNMLKQQVWPTG